MHVISPTVVCPNTISFLMPVLIVSYVVYFHLLLHIETMLQHFTYYLYCKYFSYCTNTW